MSKKNSKTTTSGDQPALKIGSRVRCTDDGVTGKITWANAMSVKIKWDDGEMVTWRRDEMPGKPIELLAADDEQPAPQSETATAEATPATEQVVTTETTAPEAEAGLEQVNVTEPQATETTTIAVPEQVAETTPTESVPPAVEQAAPKQTEGTAPALASYTPEVAAPAKPKRERKAKTPTEPKEKKVSALDAAARVLVESGTAMTCKEMIGVMAAKGYWSSPGGQTPDATLCSAILRELKVKSEQSRFVKAAPGRFASRRAR